MKEFKFKIGSVVKDKITGYTGVILGITLYHTGCIHYGIQNQELRKDGKPVDWEWIDEQRLSVIGKPIQIGRYKRVSGVFPIPCGKN